MIKKATLLTLFVFIMALSYGQSFHRVPHFKSVELGYRYISSSTFDVKNQGTTLLFDYAWQLSGFSGKPAAYISVPIGYTSLFLGEGAQNGRILSYGWAVKHELKSGCSTIPFIGYGLLLNQLSIDGAEGKVFGHQTRFDFGYLFNADQKMNLYAKIEYSMTRYPQLGQKKADKMQALELKAGVRF